MDFSHDLAIVEKLAKYHEGRALYYGPHRQAQYTSRDIVRLLGQLVHDLEHDVRVPSPADIQRRCAEVRAAWTRKQTSQRLGKPYTQGELVAKARTFSLPGLESNHWSDGLEA